MDIDGLPIIGSGVDFTQVESIYPKCTLAFINLFISSTVSFLNKFSRSCEMRLQEYEGRIQKLEAATLILESKLSSIQGLKDTHVEVHKTPEITRTEMTKDSIPAVPEVQQITEETTETSCKIPIEEDPLIQRFVRMLQFGVPEAAVRFKMAQEGVDPDLLKIQTS